MKRREILKVSEGLDIPVSIEQTGKDSFTVRYGLDVTEHLDYAEAAKQFGYCVFHSLACLGKLD